MNFKLRTISSLSAAILSFQIYALDCNSDPVNPNGDSNQLQAALQQATNTGLPIKLTGTYYISSDIKVYLKNDLSVDASGASFIATTSLDGDMFSLDAHDIKSSECGAGTGLANVSWDGGSFDMANAKVSTVVPYTSLTPVAKQGTKATADALSIRGVSNNGSSKLNHLIVENITFNGTSSSSDPFYLAGGDSGILMTGALKATIKNNSFYGVRDAAIYVSAGGANGVYGDHFTLSNNYIERAFDGITSKRGADNIKMLDNTMNDVVVGLSIKRVFNGWTATNVTIKGNIITKGVRPISIERANNVTIEGNTIYDLGEKVAGETNPRNKYGNHYEGIALNGVQGTNSIRLNTINGVSGSTREGSTTTYGIVTRDEDSRTTTGVTIVDNSFSKLDKWVKHY
ncbi:right-handed parallel beta-helix repeat-containing protein [Psychrosphaera sp. B3R10]|uniref:right-handed parallel beta-helix repeat-containing protein n=1 Tax=unclassified Psychrosphaera TaxID=2641570 RepID=UPI001C091EDD|nr:MULTISPECIES: right-handed parallel beta-helix repeat-containing protein [unclassified Psychrosphaera]MBU2883546.1 right-handed parallel beta-helix repeat-containing protein [Psychrosphaera sp. I2R16]MBU2989725.1 right-handed parallel beta-helix repeat-containing protein [Psychrosphaera sp. B3R10]